MSLLIEAVGISAGVIGIVAWGPQVRQVWIDKRHDGISIPTFVIVGLSLTMWLIYGVAIGSIAMVVSNILTLGIILIVIIGVVKCRRLEISDPV